MAQWGDPDEARKVPDYMRTLAPEFLVPLGKSAFTRLPDRDGYAPQVGFIDSFPAARDPAAGLAWLTHCYGAVGIGRGSDPASGNGSELLASLPRGTEAMGCYATPAERTVIKTVRMASDVPAAERARFEVLRTDTATFTALVAARRNRHDDWFVRSAGYIELCNVPLPVRPAPASR